MPKRLQDPLPDGASQERLEGSEVDQVTAAIYTSGRDTTDTTALNGLAQRPSRCPTRHTR